MTLEADGFLPHAGLDGVFPHALIADSVRFFHMCEDIRVESPDRFDDGKDPRRYVYLLLLIYGNRVWGVKPRGMVLRLR
jgi:hypothetical protein